MLFQRNMHNSQKKYESETPANILIYTVCTLLGQFHKILIQRSCVNNEKGLTD